MLLDQLRGEKARLLKIVECQFLIGIHPFVENERGCMVVVSYFVTLQDYDALSHTIDEVKVLVELRAQPLVERNDMEHQQCDRQDHERGDDGDDRVTQNILC